MEGELLTKGIYAGNVTHKEENICHTFLAIRDHSSDRESVPLSWWERLSRAAWSYWHRTCSGFLEFTTWSPEPDHRKRQKRQRTARYYVQPLWLTRAPILNLLWPLEKWSWYWADNAALCSQQAPAPALCLSRSTAQPHTPPDPPARAGMTHQVILICGTSLGKMGKIKTDGSG